MSEFIRVVTELKCKGSYDLIVAGGGVAGVSAAITAKRRGLKVLLIEKSNILGGLATLGLVNLFVPMCNGRGKQIIFGMADELLKESVKYGFDITPEAWRNGEPEMPDSSRLEVYFSPYIFALRLTEMVKENGVDLLFDCVVSEAVMDGKVCKGIITESKSGREYYEAKTVIDATGDADIIRRCGMPHIIGNNYYTYCGKKITLDSCRKAVETNDISNAYVGLYGGSVNLYGHNQPKDKPLWAGTTVEDVTEYLVDNQLYMLEKLKLDDRKSRDIAWMPLMPQFRTTCCLEGDYIFNEEDKYKHFDDSVCAINDFDRRDILYEVPLRCITRSEYPNIIAAGRCASATGYGWDVLRVIPPAILTGQAAAEVAALSIESGKSVATVDINILQHRLKTDGNMMIHFPDEIVPDFKDVIEKGPDNGHI